MAEKEPMSERKRKIVFIIGVIILMLVTGISIYTGVIRDDGEEETPAPAPAPSQQPLEEEELPPENPDDIGVENPEDVDFITSGERAGRMSDIPLDENLPEQSDIYDATMSAEAGIWAYENYGTETDSAEREALLKTMFASDTPLPLTLPTPEERLEAAYGIPVNFVVNIHAKNGLGGTVDDYRVELIGEKQTVLQPTDGTIIPENEVNGYDINRPENIRWEVSLKKTHVPELDEEVWVINNFTSREI